MKKFIIALLLVGCSSARPYDPNAPCENGKEECIDGVLANKCVDGVWQEASCAIVGTGYHCEYDPLLDNARCFAPGKNWNSLK